MKNILIGMYIAAISSCITAGISIVQSTRLHDTRTEFVQTICGVAHNEVSAASEEACGHAQDYTGIKYRVAL